MSYEKPLVSSVINSASSIANILSGISYKVDVCMDISRAWYLDIGNFLCAFACHLGGFYARKPCTSIIIPSYYFLAPAVWPYLIWGLFRMHTMHLKWVGVSHEILDWSNLLSPALAAFWCKQCNHMPQRLFAAEWRVRCLGDACYWQFEMIFFNQRLSV